MIEKLKPCPFCSTQPELISAIGESWALCLGCDASGPMRSCDDTATTAWNTRTESAKITEIKDQNEQLRSALRRVADYVGGSVSDSASHVFHVAVADECSSVVAALKKELAPAVEAFALLKSIMENATVYEQPEDGTRQWCSDLNIYLRGNVGMLVEITKDEKKQIDDLTSSA